MARKIRDSGRALLRHWNERIAPALDLDGTNLMGDTSAVTELLDCGAGIDFFIAYRGGRGIGGIATRAQWDGVYKTITWRNRSTGSELARSCEAYLAGDARLRPDWCVHLYEDRSTGHLFYFAAAHADDLARYYLDGQRTGNRENHEDGTPFVAFATSDLRRAGIDVRDGWYGRDPGQSRLFE